MHRKGVRGWNWKGIRKKNVSPVFIRLIADFLHVLRGMGLEGDKHVGLGLEGDKRVGLGLEGDKGVGLGYGVLENKMIISVCLVMPNNYTCESIFNLHLITFGYSCSGINPYKPSVPF